MEQATWWALFLALALISGLMSGLVWRILIAHRGIGLGRIVTFVVLALAGATSVLLVGGAIVSELFEANDAVVIPFLLPPAFAVTWLIGFRSVVRYRATARIRQRRLVAEAGSHVVTSYVRNTVGEPVGVTSTTQPVPPRPAPTPLLVGNRDVRQHPVTMQAGIEDLTLPPPVPQPLPPPSPPRG